MSRIKKAKWGRRWEGASDRGYKWEWKEHRSSREHSRMKLERHMDMDQAGLFQPC